MSDEKTFSHEAVEAYDLTEEERAALAHWFISGLDVKIDHPLVAAGLAKNCEKWAQMYGAKIIATMANEGLLKGGENPVEAFQRLVENQLENK